MLYWQPLWCFHAQRMTVPVEEGEDCGRFPNGDLDWSECNVFEQAYVRILGVQCEIHVDNEDFLDCCQQLICENC